VALTVDDQSGGGQTTATTSATGGFSFSGAGADIYQGLADQFFSGGGAGSGSSTTTTDRVPNPGYVPLWRVRPTRPTVGTGDTGLGRMRRTKALQSDEGYLSVIQDLLVPAEQARRAYLDMTSAERAELKAKLVALDRIPEDASEADVMNEWSSWVTVAIEYNTGRKADKWISPWEAMDKLAPSELGKEGAKFDGYAGPTEQTQTSIQQFTLSQLKRDAEAILMQTLGRGASRGELTRYLDAVNAAAKANPEVTVVKGSALKPDGQRDMTTTKTGGIDPVQVMQGIARQDPEYAPVQAATTYFDAAMAALNSVVDL
jgi:hypothetical protein